MLPCIPFLDGSVWKWTTIWRQNEIFLQTCACPPSEYSMNIDLHLVSDSDVRMCTTIYTRPNPIPQEMFRQKFLACSCFKKIPSLSAALTVQQWRRRDTPAYIIGDSWFQATRPWQIQLKHPILVPVWRWYSFILQMPAIAVFQSAMDSNETIIWCACFIYILCIRWGFISPFLEKFFAGFFISQGCQHVQ